MYVTSEEHFDQLLKLVADGPKHVCISTYGIYAGILDDGRDATEWGKKYANKVHDFLDAFGKGIKVQIAVGLAPFNSCQGKNLCEDCWLKYENLAARLLQHAKKWPKISWKFGVGFHLKCFLFHFSDRELRSSHEDPTFRSVGIGGGRNLSNSDWDDLTFDLTREQIIVVQRQFNKIWKKCKSVTKANLASFLENDAIMD